MPTETLLKFRFRWLANGEEHELVLEGPDYAVACYKLAWRHAMLYGTEFPRDFRIDLRTPEVVE